MGVVKDSPSVVVMIGLLVLMVLPPIQSSIRSGVEEWWSKQWGHPARVSRPGVGGGKSGGRKDSHWAASVVVMVALQLLMVLPPIQSSIRAGVE